MAFWTVLRQSFILHSAKLKYVWCGPAIYNFKKANGMISNKNLFMKIPVMLAFLGFFKSASPFQTSHFRLVLM